MLTCSHAIPLKTASGATMTTADIADRFICTLHLELLELETGKMPIRKICQQHISVADLLMLQT